MTTTFTEQELLDMLRAVEDPELGYNIVDLGLVYRAEQKGEWIEVDFTLTSPGCPIGEQLRTDIILTLREKTGLNAIRANIVWEPFWTAERASAEIRLDLGYPIW
ncbi:MAG: metal-sulfur cluster assembly factor [Treponema sp.]|nr:metal-sulfur cluster assembly factor [Treponema sp.]